MGCWSYWFLSCFTNAESECSVDVQLVTFIEHTPDIHFYCLTLKNEHYEFEIQQKDGNYNMSLLVALGCFFGLRISDILALRWNQILNVSEFTIIEHKTGKKRTIRINPQLQRHIAECYKAIHPLGKSSPILVSQKGTVYSIQRINVILKELKRRYKLHIGNFSCHSLRKTFGRQVYNMNSENSELALVKLMELFNHSSVAITKRYLGLRQEELLNTYDCLSF